MEAAHYEITGDGPDHERTYLAICLSGDRELSRGTGTTKRGAETEAAKLHFDQPASSISKKKHLELIDIAKGVLERAVLQGGTSFDEQYKNVNGESGYFSQSLNAYGQTGLACNRCGRQIKREAWANRGSHFCPGFQKLRKPRTLQ